VCLFLARTFVTRQLILIVATLYSMLSASHVVILRRRCSKDEAWSIIFDSNGARFMFYLNRRITVSNHRRERSEWSRSGA